VDSQERLKSRLDNVSAVQPILSALRSIALSSRLLALHRSESTERYVAQLEESFQQLWHAWPTGTELPWPARPQRRETLVVLGTERGLCGRLNDLLAARAGHYLRERARQGIGVRLVSLGRSTEKALKRGHWQPQWSLPLPARGLPPYDLVRRLADGWLTHFEASELDTLTVIHGVRRGLAGYAAAATPLLPPPLLPLDEREDLALPPILEGEPDALARRMLALWLCASFYGIMLRSAVAEHTARYQLLEGAAQNARELREELALQLMQERQEAITAEMQDLVAGAGLVGISTADDSVRSREA